MANPWGNPWPDRDDIDEMTKYEEWRYEVANGDTVLGFRDWMKEN